MAAPDLTPLAFLCYAHFDDDHDARFITGLREGLEREVRAQTGQTLRIFQDRRDIQWGEQWRDRVGGALEAVTFLIPIVTPSLLTSPECRGEIERFRDFEQGHGRGDLILPLYYITAPELESGAGPSTDPLVLFLRGRQFVDWRSLRHRRLNTRLAREALTDLATRLRAALRRVSPTPLYGDVPTAPGTLSTPSAASDGQMLAAVTDPDPLLAGRGAIYLADRPDLLSDLIDRHSPTPVGEAAVRSVVRRHPALSAPLLVQRVAQAGSTEGWHAARRALPYFDPGHGPYCEEQLAARVASGHMDVRRLSIEALGRCGRSGWGYDLRQLVAVDDQDVLHKLGSYVLEALGRFFVYSADEPGTPVRYASARLRELLADLAVRRPDSVRSAPLRTVLAGCDGRHADTLIREWLTDGSTEVVRLAATILGDLHVLRAVRPLIQVLDGASDARVRRAASVALGRIGSPEALDRLLAAGRDEDAARGLAFALTAIDPFERFRGVARQLLGPAAVSGGGDVSQSTHAGGGDLKILVLRAIGRRRAGEFVGALREAAAGSTPAERGVATLALARVGHAPEPHQLRLAHEQAADSAERAFTALAILTVRPAAYAELEARLRQDLGEGSCYYGPELQTDVLEVLEGTGNTEAHRLANAWRPFYPHVSLEPPLARTQPPPLAAP